MDGEREVGVVVATVEPEITVVEDLERFAAAFVLGAIPDVVPGLVTDAIEALYDDVTAEVWESLTELLEPSATTDVRVSFHLPAEETEAGAGPGELGTGDWVLFQVTNRHSRQATERSVSLGVDFDAMAIEASVADDGVRGDGRYGRYFSLELEQTDDLIGDQVNRFRAGARLQPMDLQGDVTRLRLVGEVDHRVYENESDGALDLIGGATLNAEGMGYGDDVPLTTGTIQVTGVACGRAGAIVSDEMAWIAVRSDVGDLDAAIDLADRLLGENGPDASIGDTAAQLAALFDDGCVDGSARTASNRVAELLALGVG
jgi:hypothetical protein